VDVNVPTEHRGRGIGTALLREVSRQAEQLGHVGLRCTVRGDDEKSRGYLERRGFSVRVGTHELVLELGAERPPWPEPPGGITLCWIVERPELLGEMYALAQATASMRPDFVARFARSEREWRMYELGSPLVRLDLTAIALAGGEVAGYAVGEDSLERDTLGHRSLVVGPGWESRGLAEVLVRAQISAAHAAGLRRLRVVPWMETLERMYEALGYMPRQTWLELEGPLLEPGA
jgi:predicted N-acetyltransferase YhbS